LLPGRTSKLHAIVFLVLRLGEKSLLKGRGLSAVHHHQGSPSTQQKPIAGPRELLGPVRVCVAQNGVREWCI
jgi:hypothetical protein